MKCKVNNFYFNILISGTFYVTQHKHDRFIMFYLSVKYIIRIFDYNLKTKTMKNTIILKENGNESLNFNLRFRVKTNSKRLDMFIYEKYSDAKNRVERLRNILRHSTFEILVID